MASDNEPRTPGRRTVRGGIPSPDCEPATVYRDVQDFVLNFLSIFWEAMPFVVLGALIAGILEELLPQNLIARLMPRSALPAVVVGGLLGLVFPMCECGIVVVMRRLLKKGLPLSSCIAYMLAGPIVNVVVLLSTYVAFGQHGIGPEMVLLRGGMGFLTACVTGLVVHRMYKRYGNSLLTESAAPPKVKGLGLVDDEPAAPKGSVFARLGRIAETSLHDVMDIAVFLLLGAALAALVKVFVTPDQVQTFSRELPYLAIPAMMFNSFVLCLCSEADAFVAASFTEMSVSSKLAFLVLGPMLDIKLLMMYTRVFRLRLIVTLALCTSTQVLIYSMLVHTVYNPAPGVAAAGATSPAPTPNNAPSPP